MYIQNQENIGSFIEKEFKHQFTYRNTKDAWAIEQGYEHEIDVATSGEIRFANIKKTVAYVLSGDGVEQKWLLAKNTEFSK